MTVKTEEQKPPIVEEEDFYLLVKQKLFKSDGDGRTLALLLKNRGKWLSLEQITKASRWRNPKDEIKELRYKVNHYTSDRIERDQTTGHYRIV